MPQPPPEGMNWGSPGRPAQLSFTRLLADAVADMSTSGYVSRERIEMWLSLLRNAAERELGPVTNIDDMVKRGLGATFKKLVDDGKVITYVPGVARFNIQMVRPQLRAELDRRIMASADLIKLHRREVIERTLQRFTGWSTSIPPGGDDTIDKRETRTDIGKSLAQFKYERRRVDIDQGHKLIANISEIVGLDAGAIAGVWHDHGEHDKAYNARPDHMDRAGKIYLVRDSWAHSEGLIKALNGYTDEITKPAQEPFCRCRYTWITSPRRLPDQFLTNKGQEWVERGRIEALRRAA